MSASREIIEGLRDAAAAKLSRVHVDGQTWVRQDAGSPESALAASRDTIAELTARVDALEAMCRAAGYSDAQIAAGTPYIELQGG